VRTLRTTVQRLLARFAPREKRPRVVRRVALHCPHGGALTHVDLLTGVGATPVRVLRCSARAECPPRCDCACRTLPEAIEHTAEAQIILGPGRGIPDEID